MSLKKTITKLTFTLSRRITMYEKLAAFLESGIPLLDAMRAIRDRYVERKDSRAYILSGWITSMESGSNFADAISDWIPSSELMLIEAGERGGGLSKGLREAVVLSTASARNKAAIIGGVAFPAVLLLMLMGELVLFQVKMTPVFKSLMPVEQWPSSAKTLNSLSSFVTHDMWLIFIVIGLVSFIIANTMGRWVRHPRPIFDHIPPWSIYRGYQSSSFLIALSSLMRAGIPVNDALEAMSRNASPWMLAHLNKMMVAISLGSSNMGRALDTGLLDIETAGDVQDYSRLSSFAEAINIIGERSLETGIKVIQQRMNIVKNLLLCLVAGSILWIYYASFGLQSTIANSMGKPHV